MAEARGQVGDRGRRARALAYVLVLPWIAVCLSDRRHGTALYAGGVVLAGALVLALARRAPRWLGARGFRLAEAALWNAVLAFLLGETAVRLYLALGSPVYWLTPDPDILAYRLDPARGWFGSRPNSQGFFDEEFVRERRLGVVRVVALGDSFTVGIVPYLENYLTRVDETLGPGVEIYNLGVVHTEVPHYLELLRSEGLALDPDLVLLGLYIGNDVQPADPAGLFSRDGSRLLRTARVVHTVWRHGAPYRQAGELSGLLELGPDGGRIEKPGMTEDHYYAREWKHLERLFRRPEGGRMERAWRDTLHALDGIVELCRERDLPLVATLAPDEIQVSPAVLRDTLARYDASPEAFDLDYPRRRLQAFLEERGVPVLDLSGALAAAEREAPTYHLRAVHWNRHGNAAAAAALAPWLAERLAGLGLAPASGPVGRTGPAAAQEVPQQGPAALPLAREPGAGAQ